MTLISKINLTLTLGVLTMLSLNGCVPVVGAAAATTGVFASQDRTVGNAIDDKTTWAKIKDQYIQSPDRQLLSGVNVEVIENRVLLSGSVDTQESALKAVELAWKVTSVKEVINEIQIRKKSAKNFAIDSWVTTQVKSKLLANENVRSINYHVETVNGVVYLFGLAKSQSELEAATKSASTVPEVKKVVSHVRIQK
ncbi:MAG: BON domain-containing protein [Alphaproteobacteria bacterium]|nr:BON domain-containing protein [Alphaproteobacteria bacterium]